MDREEKYFLSEIEKGISFYDAHFKLYLRWNNDKKLFVPECFQLYFVRAKATRSEDRLRFNFKAEFVADSRSMKKTFRNKQVFSTWNIIKNVASYCLDINAILTFCIICKN